MSRCHCGYHAHIQHDCAPAPARKEPSPSPPAETLDGLPEESDGEDGSVTLTAFGAGLAQGDVSGRFDCLGRCFRNDAFREHGGLKRMRCGCGHLHAHLQHACTSASTKDRVFLDSSADGRKCSDCTCGHVPCRACWVASGYLAHKFDLRFAEELKVGSCLNPGCGKTLLTRKSPVA